MENPKKLTICIPTFNRMEYIKKQINFFGTQIRNNKVLFEDVSIIVADNASTDKTVNFLSLYKKDFNFFEYVVNPSNLGLVGNIVNLLMISNTEYVWFVSDDDELKDGVIEEILKIIKWNNDPEFIYLNYRISDKIGFNGKTGYRLDSMEAALEIFQEAYGSLVFMSSCVYKKRNLLELSDNKMYKWLSAPLLYSFYSCTKGAIYISKDYWVNFHPNNASYSGLKRILKLKFEEYISILEFLPEIGYELDTTTKTMNEFFVNQSHSFLLYIFVDFQNALSLLKFYKMKAILKTPKNIFSYFKSKF